MVGLEREGPKNQQVERALQEIGLRRHRVLLYQILYQTL
jgi:hypothetical protein